LLKPLDLQTIMPRTLDIQRIEQTHNSRPLVSQQEIFREAVKQSQERQEHVLKNEASAQGNRIYDNSDDAERNRERRYRRYGQRKKTELTAKEHDQADDSGRGQHIDIKI
jgi:hypothetical protein